MSQLWLIPCAVFGGLAIAGSKGIKWKILNLMIIGILMTLGIVLGYVGGLWARDMKLAAHVGISLAGILGCLGGIICIRLNKMREMKERGK